ncbi:MAG: TlpA family protein disulfide reductase [Cyclobacteriaceae bacterium]
MMRSNTKIPILLASLLVSLFACEQEQALLDKAKNKIAEANFISFEEVSYWPNPVNPSVLVDTTKGHMEFSVNTQNFLGYDYVSISERSDQSFLNGDYRITEHADSLIRVITQLRTENRQQFESRVKNISIEWSPINLLVQDWKRLKDTTLEQVSYASYLQVEMDTIMNGRKIYVERHIYIDKETALIGRFERIAYAEDGSVSQRISKVFYDYNLQSESRQLSYIDPENYVTTYGERKPLKTLAAGDKAPDFSLTDMNGDSMKLSNLKGRKVLLDFSTIGCGYCKLALDYINQDNFKINDQVSWLYINPIDSKKKMEGYLMKSEIPFPILTDAKEIAENYGVNGYPTFFLVNEEGIIETVNVGYSEDFLDNFKL